MVLFFQRRHKFVIFTMLSLSFFAATAFFFGSCTAQAYQPMDAILQKYLAEIRSQPAALRAFFHAMPKGGDIHHHYSGAVYAEEYIEHIQARNFWVNTQDYSIEAQKPKSSSILRDSDWQSISQLQTAGRWPAMRQKLIERWSVLGYNLQNPRPRDQYFFSTFPAFAPAVSVDYKAGLQKIKARAISENISYIESIFELIQCNQNLEELQVFENQLLTLQNKRDTAGLKVLLEQLYKQIQQQPTALICAREHNKFVVDLHKKADIDDEHFTMRYQNYVLRMLPPASTFGQLFLAFESANTCPLIVGVNLVGPENAEIALRDCWLHHQFFKFYHQKYPQVKIALHAGEMTTKTAPPEHLSWHIADAIRQGQASRVGHCVSLPYEADYFALLRQMAEQKIVAEINLSSNDFILDISADNHPIMQLHKAGVPIILATDDAGILRISLTDEYVRLAQQYPQLTYRQIKNIAYNSLIYSFIKEPTLKKSLLEKLDKQFKAFEELIFKEISTKT